MPTKKLIPDFKKILSEMQNEHSQYTAEDAFNLLCQAVVDEISKFVKTTAAPRYEVVIYVSANYMLKLRESDIFRWHNQSNGCQPPYNINGWPLYIVISSTHPDYNISVKAVI